MEALHGTYPFFRIRPLSSSAALRNGPLTPLFFPRVRFSRLSRVRRELGFRGTPATFPDVEKIALDQNYMAVDIVINWAAEGLVLCFIHAVADINPAEDNNEQHKSQWTNWCGTPTMDSNQAQLLYQRLGEHVTNPGNMRRVFQILLNRSERPLWMSWPPDSSTDGPTSRDFAKLAEEVQIDNTVHGSDAKTSCTRRYKALQPIYMGPEGHKQVESIFIPYGSSPFSASLDTFLFVNKAPSSLLATKSMHILGILK